MASPFVQTRCKFDQYQMNQQNPIQIASSFDQTYLDTKHQSLQGLERPSYDGRSPTTPKSSLALGTSESGSFPPQLIRTGLRARHQKALSNQWDGTPGSVQSYVESSPISSSVHQSHHTGISEILKSGKHASLPAKVDNHLPGGGGNLKSKEAKHRCRRSSHNLIERRRRDNINERIQDLSHLVPQHRLEDDKVRKQLVNTSALSMAGAGGNATNPRNDHRTIPGNIAMGLSIEWGEKGLKKGDILNGVVRWNRDLIRVLHVKYQQEAELAELIRSLGGTWPFEQCEEEKRMRNSGRRVPKHTNLAGDAVQGGDMSGLTPPSLSPSYRSSDSSAKGAGQSQHWKNADHAA
ncbi:uncharacterized protein N7506_005526 [Penicillium brevicompactum]|uniref:uncharacterized protein n=1 Tax=Penicillium brevicompactum TaxID=5074 RepID=UPI0025414A6A|nr:uncharacterized protein N7506_005526 [Penicillium brevicompactum]KAJ5337504.1 hypothetical protein N7506_005526 [Penicillium brevicompactum]